MKLGRNKSAGLHVEMQIKWEEMFPAIYRLSWPRFQLFLLPFFFFYIFLLLHLSNKYQNGWSRTNKTPHF